MLSIFRLACFLLLYMIHERQCEVFDLEKVLKQITPEEPEDLNPEKGEFSRFRRSRILSASEEKNLIDEGNTFDGSFDEDVMGSKQEDGASGIDSEKPKAHAKNEAKRETTTTNNATLSTAENSTSDLKNILSSMSKATHKTHSANATKSDTKTTARSHTSKVGNITESGARLDTPKSRSDIVMFSMKPVDKSVPSINETSSMLDFAKVAKEISATNDTKSNRRYEVPREESGSGSGWEDQSGSGEKDDEDVKKVHVKVIKSAVKHTAASVKPKTLTPGKHNAISVNEVQFLSNLSPSPSSLSSGSGSEDGDTDNDSGSGSGERVIEQKKVHEHKNEKLIKSAKKSTTSYETESNHIDMDRAQDLKGKERATYTFSKPSEDKTNNFEIQKDSAKYTASAWKKSSGPDIVPEVGAAKVPDNALWKISHGSNESVSSQNATKDESSKREEVNATKAAAPSNETAARKDTTMSSANTTSENITVSEQPQVTKNTTEGTSNATQRWSLKDVETTSNLSRVNEKNTSANIDNELTSKTKDNSKNKTAVETSPMINTTTEAKSNLTSSNTSTSHLTRTVEKVSTAPANSTPGENNTVEASDEIMSFYHNLTESYARDMAANYTRVTAKEEAESKAANSTDDSYVRSNVTTSESAAIVPAANLPAATKMNLVSEAAMGELGEGNTIVDNANLARDAAKLFDFETSQNSEGSWADISDKTAYVKEDAARAETPRPSYTNDADEDLPGGIGGLSEDDLQGLQKYPDNLHANEVDDDIMSTADTVQRANDESKTATVTKNTVPADSTPTAANASKKSEIIDGDKKAKKDKGVEMQIESTIKSSFDESIKNLVSNNTLTNDILPGDYGDETPLIMEESGSGSGDQSSGNDANEYSASGSGETDSEVSMLLKAVANNRNLEKGSVKAAVASTNGSLAQPDTVNNNNTTKEESSGEESLSGDYLTESGSGSGASGDSDFQVASADEAEVKKAVKENPIAIMPSNVHPTIANRPIQFYSANVTTTPKQMETTGKPARDSLTFGEGSAAIAASADDSTKTETAETADTEETPEESASGSGSGSDTVMEKLNEIVNDNEKVSASPNLDEASGEKAEKPPAEIVSTTTKPSVSNIVATTTTEPSAISTKSPTSRAIIHKKKSRPKPTKKEIKKETKKETTQEET